MSGLIALLCSFDYAYQMLQSVHFESFVYQTFGPSVVMAAAGALMAIVGTLLVQLSAGKKARLN